jgi:tetratricopeptide (TPR) repeat protein
MLALSILAFVIPVWTSISPPVQAPRPDSFDAVRQMVADARKEIEAFESSKPAAGSQHPAIKWDGALWAVHERAPQTEAGALAAVEAVRLLTSADLWTRADARVDSLSMDDPAWQGLPWVLYEAGIERKDLPGVIARLSRVAEAAPQPTTKAAALMILGRAYRRQGDFSAATRSLEAARAAAPESTYAEESKGIIYEIEYLSPGKTAPAISAKARNGKTISLAALRGKPVVLVFWGTT